MPKMITDHDMGPLMAAALGDAYGAGFEFVPAKVVEAHNDLSCYRPHQKWKTLKPGSYTDDTQMAMGIVEHMLDPKALWTLPYLADRWVRGFKRDVRTGYAGGFYKLLQEVNSGMQLVARIRPDSEKNGGAMRAWPLGFYSKAREVRDLAMRQAAVTHCTAEGMAAAAASALAFHYCYHGVGPLDELPRFLRNWTGYNYELFLSEDYGLIKFPKGVPTNGIDTMVAVLHVLLTSKDMAEVVQKAVALRGDTDTVASIALACASVCGIGTRFPKVLIDNLENGDYGRDYIKDLDHQMLAVFPSKAKSSPPPVEDPVEDKPLLEIIPDTEDSDNWFDQLFGEES